MAKGKGEVKGWITRNGVHIPIYGHYSVRGGVEPKAKGAKFKGKKKKELSPRQVRQATTYLSTSNKESIKAVKEELDKMDDSKEVFSGVTVKDLKEHFSGVDENITLGEYRKQLFDRNDQDTSIKEGKKPVTKDEEYKSKLAEANKAFDAGDYKEYNRRAKELKQMQASGDVSEDTITGKTQAQRERDEAKFQARQRANEANSLVNEGMDKDQARKVVSGQASSKAANGAPRVTDEDAGHNKEVEWNGGRYQTQQVVDWDRNKNQEYVAGHLYVPIDPKNGEKQFFVANEDGSVHSSGTDYLNKKNALPNPWKEKASGQESSKPAATPTISPKTQRVADNARKSLMFDKGYAEIAANQWSWAGMSNDKVIAAMNATDPKYSYELRKEQTKGLGAMPNATVNHNRLYRTEKNVGDTAASKSAGDRSKPISKQDSLSASMNERSRIRGELHAKDKAMKAAMPTTVSGLRSAYAEATGSMKSKIAAELRRKGYLLVGGKWVKGRKE